RPGEQLDIVLLPPVRIEEGGILAPGLAAQVVLRERRALVRRVRLPADQQDRPVGALLAQRPGAAGGRNAAAYQQVVDPAVPHYAAAGSWPGGVKRDVIFSSSPVSSTSSTSSPISITESASGTKPVPSRRI